MTVSETNQYRVYPKFTIYGVISLKKPKEALKHQKGAQKQAVRRAAKKYIKVGELNCRHRQSHHGRYNLSSLIELIPLIWKLLQNAQSVYQQGSL